MPATAAGTLVDGGSAANLIGLTVARNAMAGVDVREEGVAAMPTPLRFYGSDQVAQLPSQGGGGAGPGQPGAAPDPDRRRLPDRPRRAAPPRLPTTAPQGLRPACVIANAGTVNTGAIDDLDALAALSAAEGLWFHVDGCIGALLAIAPANRHRVAGLERADSLALDPHKWLHAPFDVGCALVRDAARTAAGLCDDAGISGNRAARRGRRPLAV